MRHIFVDGDRYTLIDMARLDNGPAARDLAGEHAIWAGIGAYHLSSEQIVDNVRAARRIGVGGVILFSYDSLTEPSHGPDYLAQVGRAAFNNR